jgi:hypothetical protein
MDGFSILLSNNEDNICVNDDVSNDNNIAYNEKCK